MSSRRIDIELLRIVCIAAVVFFHTDTRFVHPQMSVGLPQWVHTISTLGVWIAVPMFFFISGFLFWGQLERNRYASLGGLAKSKAIHLLVPYVVFTVLMMLATGYFDYNQIIKGGFWHLWFLPTLFCCFVAYYLIYRHLLSCKQSIKWQLVVLVVSYLLTLLVIPLEWCYAGIDGVLKWGFCFALGITVGRYENTFERVLSKCWFTILLCIIWAVNSFCFPTPYMTVTWNNTLAVSAMILALFTTFGKLPINERGSKHIVAISSTAMGVYILHYWVLVYATSTTSLRMLGCFGDKSPGYMSTVMIGITLVVFILSILITRLIMSNRYTKPLLG